jgi:cobyrinic acid a,c-diamide synthase
VEPICLSQENMGIPGIVIAALRGGAGKTIFSVGIISALKKQGLSVAPFKKGPDYIDAGWLAVAAGRPCYNLDTFLIASEAIRRSFFTHTGAGDIAVIEGNRGLYDCIDTEGKTSTAELAKLLELPVILCVDSTKTTRTMAAVVSGCMAFDPQLTIAGVVLNRVAGARHERILRDSIAQYCGVPVLGAVPKLGQQSFPERHMGLVPTMEHGWVAESIETIADIACRYMDLDAILDVARHSRQPARNPETRGSAPGRVSAAPSPIPAPGSVICDGPPVVRIGIIRDSAFQFYYPENIEALMAQGAEMVFLSPLSQPHLPDVDALYIGGGFPETHARQLADKDVFRMEIKQRVEAGLPIYAECGGLMYLGESLHLEGRVFPMAGVLPVAFGFCKKPQGHGYTQITVEGQNPFYPSGTRIRGHEFHYSKVISFGARVQDLVFRMDRGTGLVDGRDGVCYRNVLASYTHIHAAGTPQWAASLVTQAMAYQKTKRRW